MKFLRWRYIAIILVLVVIGPVLARQLLPPEPRHYEYATLDDARYLEIRFRNRAQDIDLGGMLFVPAGDGPFPAAVVIHGSGTSQRGNGWYLTLAHYLQRNGVLVLLPDKRGSEESGGDWRSAGPLDLATDTLAAIEYLDNRDDIDVSAIGVIGMSQGGWIAPIVATQSAAVDFVVNMVGSAVPPREQLVYEENLNLQQMGFLPGISNALSWISTAHIRKVRQREFWDAFGDFDPLDYWQDVSARTLALYGGADTNVPSRRSARRLQALGKANIEVIVYEGSGHALQDPPGDGNKLIRDDALTAMRNFIHRSK